MALRILCLDIEGGYGGSSRSLYEILRHIDRSQVEPVVWCRKEGPVQDQYRACGIETRIMPEMPTITALPKLSRNLYTFGRFVLTDWPRSRSFRGALKNAAARFDLIHCNHESLFLVSRWLAPRISIPITFHIRTNLWNSAVARFQVRTISNSAANTVFITENERDTFQRHLGAEPNGAVIYNPAAPPSVPPAPYPGIDDDGRLRLACLSNFSWGRGVDRLVDLAESLAAIGRRDILFVVAGNMQLTASIPGELGRVARRGGTLADYAAARGVADMFMFLGHVKEPECVLAGCDALIKLSREANPWGRDIIEALAMSRPAISLGRWDGFIGNGETGILHETFEPEALAADIAALADNRERLAAMGRAGRDRIALLCDPSARAGDMARFWQETVEQPDPA